LENEIVRVIVHCGLAGIGSTKFRNWFYSQKPELVLQKRELVLQAQKCAEWKECAPEGEIGNALAQMAPFPSGNCSEAMLELEESGIFHLNIFCTHFVFAHHSKKGKRSKTISFFQKMRKCQFLCHWQL